MKYVYVFSRRVGKHDVAYLAFSNKEDAEAHLDKNCKHSYQTIELRGNIPSPLPKAKNTRNIWKDTQFDRIMNEDISKMEHSRLFFVLRSLGGLLYHTPLECAGPVEKILSGDGTSDVCKRITAARDLIHKHEEHIHKSLHS